MRMSIFPKTFPSTPTILVDPISHHQSPFCLPSSQFTRGRIDMAARAALSTLKSRIPTPMHKTIDMAARAAGEDRLPTQGRACFLFGRDDIAALSFRRRIIEPVSKRATETEVEKALRTGDAFVKCRLLEDLQVSTIKEGNLSHNDKPSFVAMSGDLRFTVLSLEDDDGNMSQKYDINPPSPYSGSQYCCSTCFGVLCFMDNRNILLWNPTTNESKILPDQCQPEFPSATKQLGHVTCGLWVDNKSQDYKVARFNEWHYYECDGQHTEPGDDIEFALYSFKTDSWKKISCPGFLCIGPSRALINGVYYMSVGHRELDDPVILTFDFSTETISYIPLPFSDFRPYHILDYNGLLSIISYKSYKAERFYEHWVMRNGSWYKLSFFHTCNVDRALGFSRNCESLFFRSLNRHQLLVLDYATGKLKHHDHVSGYKIRELIPFSKSFVKLNGPSEIEEHEKEENGPTIEEAYCGPLLMA